MTEYILDIPMYVIKSESNNLLYDFLKYTKGKEYYYEILNSQNKYQLKSLFDFISEHIRICSHLLNGDIIKPYNKIKDINSEIKNFINNSVAREIFIINLIRVYFR